MNNLPMIQKTKKKKISRFKKITLFCQTPIPGQTWKLTLLSRGNKKNKPHPNYPRRGCPRVLKFWMWPSVTKRIRLHLYKKF